MTATLHAQPLKLLTLVRISSSPYELGVGVVDRSGLAALTTHDRKSLLSQVPASHQRRQVRCARTTAPSESASI